MNIGEVRYKPKFLEKLTNEMSENGNPICPGRKCKEEITPEQISVIETDENDGVELWHLNCPAEEDDDAAFDMDFGG